MSRCGFWGGVSRRFRQQILRSIMAQVWFVACGSFDSPPGNVRAARLSKRLRVIGGPHTSIDLSILLVDLDF